MNNFIGILKGIGLVLIFFAIIVGIALLGKISSVAALVLVITAMIILGGMLLAIIMGWIE